MKTQDLVKCALFTAVICISAYICVPLPFTPVPITLQTAAVMLCAVLLGGRRGAAAVVLYVILGAIGLPVFSGGKGGIGVLAGATGGYIWGFIPAAYITGKIAEVLSIKRFKAYLAVMALGIVIIYIAGTMQYSITANISFTAALASAVTPFVFADAVKIAAAALIAGRLKCVYFQS